MKNYSLGLDIGTNSVGWALVDENNQIVKKNGFAFWGVRMFDEAQSAQDRRTHRSSRRRLARRNERIKLLKAEFENEIAKVDPYFFQRIEDSFYKQEDKQLKNHYTFFNDSYTDKEFFEKYETIYHLRKDLLDKDEKFDIRMLYLAIHHMIKYRGHFLYEGKFNTKDTSKIKDNLIMINNMLNEIIVRFPDNEEFFQEIDYSIDKEKFFNRLEEILVNTKTKKDKKNELKELFNVEKNTFVNEVIIPLLTGSKVNLSNISLIKDEKHEKIELTLDEENLDEKIENAKKEINELSSLFDSLYIVKEISDYYYLIKILGKNSYISEAMVNVYEKHNLDLKKLKKIIKEYASDKYYECFKKCDDKLNNYSKYVGYNNTNKNPKRFSHCSKEDFYKYIKGILKDINCEEARNIENEIDNDNFLPRQNSSHNSSIPMQLNLMELEEILSKQSKYYSFLNESDGKYTRIERIISIFKYHLPYYVGPLNTKSERSWVIRTNEKIYPWNYKEVIDFDETAKKFIERMQNKCTYLHGDNDYCLPKKSLLFSEYNCLQYLNNIKINGNNLDYQLKESLFNEVFLKNKKPTKRTIIDYIVSNYNCSKDELSSSLEEVPCDMSSYIKFKEIFKDDFEKNKNMIEEIIKDITIFEDKELLAKRLHNEYNLDSEKVKEIKGLNYKGYSSLSRNLLEGLCSVNKETGEVYGTIIEIMRKTSLNLQQILYHPDYKFNELINDYNKENLKEETYTVSEYIEENLYVSPIMKRPLLQSCKIIEELQNIFPNDRIEKFYVECTRTNRAEKKRTNSRYNSIKELLKSCENDVDLLRKFNIDINKLNEKLESKKDDLRSDKLYFYFTQLGKSMYSLKDIDLNGLINGEFDIDHIYPQSLIKDDSLSNRVLVEKSYNQGVKKDKFLFETEGIITSDTISFWNMLLRKKLITKEKYNRLTEKEISEEKLNNFINRQLVATNQAVKGLIDVLKQYYNIDEKNIIYSKSENVSEFRKKYDILKSRLANNYHHAHDAYLNVVVGGVIDKYYRYYGVIKYNDYLRMQNNNITINPMKIFEKDRIYGKSIIWKKDEMLNIINKNVKKRFDISETTRTYISNEMFSKVTILPARNGKVPVKNNSLLENVEKYGGITSNKYSKYCLVETIDKKGRNYILEAIPKINENNIEKYLKNNYKQKYSSFKIINENIKINTVILDKKRKYCITGNTGNNIYIRNSFDKNFSYNAIYIIHNIEKYNELVNNGYKCCDDSNIIITVNSKGMKRVITNEDCNLVITEIMKNFEKNIFNYSVIEKVPKLLNKAISLDLETKAKLIIELLKLLRTNGKSCGNLESIGLAKSSGITSISNKLNGGVKIVEESVTGYYKKIIFEVPSGI